MNRYTVDGGRVDHHGQCPCKSSLLERLKVFLTDHLRRQIGGSTVLAGPGRTVSEIMLGTGSYVVLVNMIGVITLVALDFCHHHLGVHNGVLTETLVDTRPSWVTTQVNDWIVYPGTVGGAALIGGNLCTDANQFRIKRGSHIDRLGEECSALSIGDAMVMVETIDVWYTDIFHRFLLNQANPFLPLLNTGGTGARGIQYGTDFPLRDQCVEHHLV